MSYQKRAITSAEHAAVLARELNPERRDFYELLWHTGASQTDAACLTAEDVNWNTRTISYIRKKLKSRVGTKHALIRFGDEVAAILQRRPQSGPLFPYLRNVRAGDRATEFKQRCEGLDIKGVKWVLGFGTHATVVRPDKLRQRLFKVSEEVWQRYGGPMVLHEKA